MTKYILHGGFTRADNELNRSFFSEFGNNLKDGDKILLVLFASTNPYKEELFRDLVKRFNSHIHAANVSFTHATEADFEAQLLEASAVYIHGGNTPTLMTALKNYPNLKEKFSGKTIAGSSAGAYALATYCTAHTEEHFRKGLGILPIRLVCHFESAELPPSDTSLAELREADQSLELICLRDSEWKVVQV
jgi:peptidase E